MSYLVLLTANHALFLTCLAIHCVVGTSAFWLAARYLGLRRSATARETSLLSYPLPADENLPDVLLQLPTFDEGNLILRAADAARRLDWPRARLHVQILDDSTNLDSRASAQLAAAMVREAGIDGVLIAREDRQGFKAGALAAGLSRSRAEFVAILDADYIPEPDFLRLCMRPLLNDTALAFVQARCDYVNAGANGMTKSQQRILDAHFVVEQAARNWSGNLMPFNGTCGIWRTAAIKSAGGWQSDTLAEDLDLSYRAQLHGWSALFLSTVTVKGELPSTLSTWRKQQFRWTKGFAEAARKLLPKVWDSHLPFRKKFVSTLHLASGVLGPLAAVTLVSGLVDFIFGYGPTAASVALILYSLFGGAIIGPALLMTIAQITARGSRLNVELPRLPGVLYLQITTGLGNIGGAVDALLGRASVFERTPKCAANPLSAPPKAYVSGTRP